MSQFEGAISALPTPFKNSSLDIQSLKRLVKFQLDNGIQGFVVNGTTGESPTLLAAEVEEVFTIVKSEVAGQVPILVGTGSNSTQKTIEDSIKAEKFGADGLLIVTPYYNKPPQRALVLHFKAIAESVSTPILLYNVPGRTAVSLGAEATIELSRMPNIVGIKDATADLELGRKIIEGTAAEFVVTSGDDFTFLELAGLGGKGVISVLSNIIPKETVSMLARVRSGDKTSLVELQKYKELTRLLFVEANPIPVKAALHYMGIFETDELRLPLVALEDKYKRELEQELRRLEILR